MNSSRNFVTIVGFWRVNMPAQSEMDIVVVDGLGFGRTR